MKTTPGVVAEVKNKMCLAEAHLIVVVCQKALSCFFRNIIVSKNFFPHPFISLYHSPCFIGIANKVNKNALKIVFSLACLKTTKEMRR